MTNEQLQNYYTLLGVDRGVTREEAHDAFIRRSRVVQPDRFDKETEPDEWKHANEMVAELTAAYQVILKDIASGESLKPWEQPDTEPAYQPPATVTIPLKRDYLISSGMAVASELPPNSLERLKAIQSGEEKDKLFIGSKRVLGSYLRILWILVPIATSFLLWDMFVWNPLIQFIMLAVSLICTSISAVNATELFQWYTRPLRPGVMVTPLHLISIDQDGLIQYRSLEDYQVLVSKQLGTLQSTVTAAIEFGNETVHFTLENRKHAAALEHVLVIAHNNLLNIPEAKLTEFIAKNNVFSGVTGVVTLEPKSRRRASPSLAAAVIAGLLIGIVIFKTGLTYNEEFAKQWPEYSAATETSQDNSGYKRRPLTVDAVPVVKEPVRRFPGTAPSRPDAGYTAPTSGFLHRSSAGEDVPFKFTAAGGGTHYRIQITRTGGEQVWDLIIRSGQVLWAGVPSGSYKLKIYSGQQWVDEASGFGADQVELDDPTVYELRGEPGRPMMAKSIELKTSNTSGSRKIVVTNLDLAVN